MFRFVHHIGTFLLLVATALLIVTSISAPVINDIGLLTVNLQDETIGKEVSFGTFGYCIQESVRNGGKDECSKAKLGYSPAEVMFAIDGSQFSDYAERTARGLTKVMVLHPVGAGLCFLAFVMAAGAGVLGSFLASLTAALAFVVTLVVLIVDFVLFGIIKNGVNDDNDNDRSSRLGIRGNTAYFSVAMWTVLGAGICTFLAAIVLFFTCCTGRVKKHRQDRKIESSTYHSPPRTTAHRRRYFWQRRARV